MGMYEEVEKYLLKKGLWPLATLVPSILTWYGFFSEYHDEITRFRDVLCNGHFIAGCAAILLGTICLQIIVSAADAPVAGVIISGMFTVCALAIIIYYSDIPPEPEPLPKDKLVVLIAHFNELGSGAKGRGETITREIIKQLEKKISDGAPLKLLLLDKPIKSGPGSKEEARRIGQAPDTQAHIVVHGDVVLEDKELEIDPEITVIHKFGGQEIEERKVETGRTTDEPEYLNLKRTKVSETADMVALITGLAFFKVKKYDDALVFLSAANNAESAFYRGYIFDEKANFSSDPVKLYKKAADEYNRALEAWKRETLPQAWAMTQNNLGNAYVNLGERVGGSGGVGYLKKAVAAYNEALKEYKRETLPQYWAGTQNNLGGAYQDLGQRVSGFEGVNYLNMAVAAYTETLKEYRQKTSPQNWAGTQNNLGVVYQSLGERVGGAEGIDYLNKAVAVFTEALKEYKQKTSPQDWAMTQNNLGNAYLRLGERMGGAEGIDYLNKAVAAYTEALKEYKRETLPQYWATTQNNLGLVYQNVGQRVSRFEGVDYLNKAVAAYNEALKERKRETLPQDWSLTQNNLGNAYVCLGERLDGADGIDYLNKAVAAYNEALEERKREILPQNWAGTQNNLGFAYQNLGQRLGRAGRAEGIDYLNKAVTAYIEALEEHKRETLPQAWAGTQNNLGNAYRNLGELLGGTEGIDYLNKAVAAYTEALKERKRETLPQAWAGTQNNLGIAYERLGERMGGDEGIEYLNKAVAAYDAALEIFTDGYYHEITTQNRQKVLDALAKLQSEQKSRAGNGGGGEVK